MKKIIILLFVSAFLFLSKSYSQNNNAFEISKNLEIYADVFKQLNNNYVDEIKPGELTKTAIDAFLETLDPYTVYKSESEIEDFRFMTTGQYGGIGALIQKHEDYVVISEPYKDFPADKAGVKAGDKILKIDGHDAQNLSTSEVSEMLKGQPETEFILCLERYGEEKPLNITVNREKIQINDIPYYGMANDHIGYISLSSFTQHAASHVKSAFMDLKSNNELEGIILDLRGNGGGLLNEAVDLVNIWVDKGNLIVSTKGRLPEKSKDHFTRMSVVDPDIPVAVLVNGGSASASEIVAGAIQDLDRGVIVGSKTYGKGLVQNIVPLSYNAQIKITVAKYYIPSGRCIQAIDYSHNGSDGPTKIADSLYNEFQTRNGRKVYDGGGVIPDLKSEERTVHDITMSLLSKHLIFDFCTEYYWNNQEVPGPREFEITDEMYAAFVAFLADKNFSYKTQSEQILKDLKEASLEEKYYDAIKEELDALESALSHDKKSDLDKFRDEISEFIRIEITPRYFYQAGMMEANLVHDPEVKQAIEVLQDKTKYKAILH